MTGGESAADQTFLAARVAAVLILRSAANWSLPEQAWEQVDPALPSVAHTLDKLTRSLAEQNGHVLAAAVEDLRYYANHGGQRETRGVLVGSLTTPSTDADPGSVSTGYAGPPPEIRLRIDTIVTALDIPTAKVVLEQDGHGAGYEGQSVADSDFSRFGQT
ncbi:MULTISPECIES: hypothetical protein [unclassified Pseudofrankia]|uniref:hypothetical protein n=1 Tax=unclassified Pseudofrankia TaxID=2994372 RepID=UPI0008DB1034|nr:MULTISPECIES: hypothetical protein [unclassified Pseudofrankia]MDT3443940.1 hypothetical protein [Pseudofrankia sp. BMG5.37]OHV68205.1 hypothetical protein BCD48_03225 [Pseudofrankia sp. BMG5.36]